MMMDFKAEYIKCASRYSPDKSLIDLEDLGMQIANFSFHSDFIDDFPDEQVISGDLYYHELVQNKFSENSDFIYPVVLPEGERKYSHGILFFHGLNERSWDKYLVWATYLAEHTHRPVIMFPIAYHINRAPKRWSDPRGMAEVVAVRKQATSKTTFLNAALSTRLEKHPEKFIISGLQSYFDVRKLVHTMKSGEHPVFETNAHFDIFSYSIGAFLSEVIVLNNPEKMFDHSKLFMFCGGTTFDSMNGISKFIMDEKAFESLKLMNDKKKLRRFKRKMFRFRIDHFKVAWKGLYLMINSQNRRRKRERLLKAIGHNIFAVALARDTVIPAEKIVETLKGKKRNLPVRVEIIDFPYEYSHEIPFPTSNEQIQPLVSRSFTAVFDKAVQFFITERSEHK